MCVGTKHLLPCKLSQFFRFRWLRCRAVVVVLISREEGKRFHQLIALADWDVTVVQAFRRLAINVEPPVALQNCLIKQRRLWTQEALHYQAVIRQGTHVKYLKDASYSYETKNQLSFSVNCSHTHTFTRRNNI